MTFFKFELLIGNYLNKRMKSLTNELQQALMQVGSAVYAQAGGNGRNTSSGDRTTGEDVIDADFVESK